MCVWEVLPFKMALWLSHLSKIGLCICLMPVFRMCWCLLYRIKCQCWCIFYRIKSYQLSCADQERTGCIYKKLYQGVIIPVCLWKCLAVEWWEHEFLCTSASTQRFQVMCCKFLIVKKPMTLLHMLSKTKAFDAASCLIPSVVYFRILSNF